MLQLMTFGLYSILLIQPLLAVGQQFEEFRPANLFAEEYQPWVQAAADSIEPFDDEASFDDEEVWDPVDIEELIAPDTRSFLEEDERQWDLAPVEDLLSLEEDPLTAEIEDEEQFFPTAEELANFGEETVTVGEDDVWGIPSDIEEDELAYVGYEPLSVGEENAGFIAEDLLLDINDLNIETLSVEGPAGVEVDNDVTHHVNIRSTNVQGNAMCKTCVSFAEQALNQLLNIILQVGVVGTCNELCSKVPGPALVQVTCNVLCDVVGVKEFVKIVKDADLDSIYYCQLLTACPYNDHGDAKFTAIKVDPTSGPQGTFNLLLQFESKNGTSTGQVYVHIDTVDHIPASGGWLMTELKPGVYNAKIKISATPSSSCDPTAGPCEKWLPGNYLLKTALCAGKCGSKHPHSKVYDTASTTFTITSS